MAIYSSKIKIYVTAFVDTVIYYEGMLKAIIDLLIHRPLLFTIKTQHHEKICIYFLRPIDF